MLENYFKRLYERTMSEAYALAHEAILDAMSGSRKCLDCGAGEGHEYALLKDRLGIEDLQYYGIEWSENLVSAARSKGLNISQADLNKKMNFQDNEFDCVFGLSVLEHLLNPCQYLKESHRVLKQGGRLVILTPNISTYFTALLILMGKMPSSGPHPDSEILLKSQELFKVSSDTLETDVEEAMPSHRHLVVFSFRVLKAYLELMGFSDVRGNGFGLYPFPNFMQPFLERIDPYHCHQMVFVATKK